VPPTTETTAALSAQVPTAEMVAASLGWHADRRADDPPARQRLPEQAVDRLLATLALASERP